MSTDRRFCTLPLYSLWGYLVLAFVAPFINAQNPVLQADSVYRQEMDFGQYLLNNQMYAEAVRVFSNLDTVSIGKLSAPHADSLHYYLGWAHYNLKQLLPSSEQLLQVSGNSVFYPASRYFAAYNLAYKENYLPASGILQDLYLGNDSLLAELRVFQLSGMALLQRNFGQFRVYSNKFTFSHYQLLQEEQNMLTSYAQLQKIKRRSPALAGILSAVVPGLGKIYAGKVKQGVASFFPVVLMGFQAYENIHKRGIKNGFSIFYTGLFSVFYVGNIWGSALSVQIKQQEAYHEVDNHILFDLHIPLRNIFGN